MQKHISLNNHKSSYPIIEKEREKETTEVVKKYCYDVDRYYQIEKKSLSAEYEVSFNIFVHKNLVFEQILNASPSKPAKIPLDLLEADGDIMISASDIPLYNEYLESLEQNPPPGKNIKEIKAIAIKEKSKVLIKNVLLDPRSGENIKQTSRAVESIVSAIIEDKDTLYNLISIKNYDYYTYTHSVNVAVLSIGMGVALGLSAQQIANLGYGTMLHDIGKSTISPEILNKPSGLTSMEYQIMKNHVMEGQRILDKHECFPKDSMSSVTQHHEKLSGKGYPLGLQAANINLYGRISAIADCYDALTTQRAYKPALKPFEALSIIIKDTDDYDQELLKIFIKMLGKIE